MQRSESLGRISRVEQVTDRLRSSRDFRRVYRRGRRLHGEVAVLHVCRNRVGRTRLGLTIGRWVGDAVTRNRLRRRVRERWRQTAAGRGLLPLDLVVHLKPRAALASRRSFYRELDRLFGLVASNRGGLQGSRVRRRTRR